MGERTPTRLRLNGVPAADWFVQVEDYPGVGLQLAARDPLTLPPRDVATRGLRALLAERRARRRDRADLGDARGVGFATEPPATAGHNPK